MKISIVIPVYNEAEQLDVCLSAIASQNLQPYEVLVIDNNSQDNTVAVASCYPFVKILRQSRQGAVHARNLGFDAACGDIIGRIDADTILPANWTETVRTIFSDTSIDAVSGCVYYYNLPFRKLLSKIDLFFRTLIYKGMKGEICLYGANMAIRRDLWLKTRDSVCSKGGLHEDFDLAIHAFDAGGSVTFDERLYAGVSIRRFDTNFRQNWSYIWLCPGTYALHGRTSQKHMYSACIAILAFYLPLKLAYRGYNPETEQLSWQKFVTASPRVRVNPATFVD